MYVHSNSHLFSMHQKIALRTFGCYVGYSSFGISELVSSKGGLFEYAKPRSLRIYIYGDSVSSYRLTILLFDLPVNQPFEALTAYETSVSGTRMIAK